MAGRDIKISGHSRQPRPVQHQSSAEDEEKRTSDHSDLFEACKNGDLETVQTILQQRQVSANERDLHGRKSTPLHFAAGEKK